ncbi:RALF-like 34 protein [Nymphaea thermarum]|nr:RALF-like 34 protein [Nymphaea thermarum]
MAPCSKLCSLLLLLLLQSLLIPAVLCAERQELGGEVEEEDEGMSLDLAREAIGWSSSELEEMVGFSDDSEVGGELGNRRSLFWRALHYYYISYGALSANRIPCPPRSGRSYYTHNCYRARGPVRPYHRGCSAITRCTRSTY